MRIGRGSVARNNIDPYATSHSSINGLNRLKGLPTTTTNVYRIPYAVWRLLRTFRPADECLPHLCLLVSYPDLLQGVCRPVPLPVGDVVGLELAPELLDRQRAPPEQQRGGAGVVGRQDHRLLARSCRNTRRSFWSVLLLASRRAVQWPRESTCQIECFLPRRFYCNIKMEVSVSVTFHPYAMIKNTFLSNS